jgi:hypothetical protein
MLKTKQSKKAKVDNFKNTPKEGKNQLVDITL